MSAGQIIAILIALSVLILIFKFRGNLLMVRALRTYTQKDRSKGIEQIRTALKASMSPQSRLTCGFYLLREGNIDEAESIITPLTSTMTKKFNPNRAKVQVSLILWKRGELDAAVETLTSLLQEDFRTSVLYMNLGFFMLEKGDYKKALEVNLEAYEYDRHAAVIRDNLGLNYIKLEEWEKALEIYDPLIEEKPSFPDVYVNRARIHMHYKQWKEASALLETALEKNFSFLSTVSKDEINSLLKIIDENI